MAESNSQLWWEEITGPSQLVRTAASSLLNGESVLLCVPGDLPWPEQMRASIEQELREDAEDLLVYYINGQSVGGPKDRMRVAEFLLSKYAKPNVRDGYRRSSKQSIQDYTIKNQVLKNKVIWVQNLKGQDIKEWIDYCKEYRPKSAADGVFILECLEAPGTKIEAHGLTRLSYDDYARYYDELLFNNLIAAPLGSYSPQWRQYLATAATELCKKDAQLADYLIERLTHDAGDKDPIAGLMEITQDSEYANRYEQDGLKYNHPFALVKSGYLDELDYELWKAQLQVLYPLIEFERVDFIEHFYDSITLALDQEYDDARSGTHEPQYVTQLNERIHNPYDVEIGTLYRMNKLRLHRDNSLYLLYIANEEDRDRLELLREMRNQIAHMGACPADQVSQFLNSFPYRWRSPAYGYSSSNMMD